MICLFHIWVKIKKWNWNHNIFKPSSRIHFTLDKVLRSGTYSSTEDLLGFRGVTEENFTHWLHWYCSEVLYNQCTVCSKTANNRCILCFDNISCLKAVFLLHVLENKISISSITAAVPLLLLLHWSLVHGIDILLHPLMRKRGVW